MAEGIRYVCKKCRQAIEAWSDGNPYFIDEEGAKQYAYHPDHERLSRCIGNDTPHLCLSCAHEFLVDSRSPMDSCPACAASSIVSTFELGGRRCPYCQAGVFLRDQTFDAIS